MKRIVLIVLTCITTSFFCLSSFIQNATVLAADTPTPTPSVSPSPTPDNSQQIQNIENQINDLQKKISDTQGQEKTLSSQITVLDNQIKLTQLRIASTKQQITQLTLDIDTSTKKIASLEGSIDNVTKILLNRIVTTYEVGSIQPIQILASSNDLSDFFKRANYLRLVQDHDKQLLYETVQAKYDYANEKEIFESEKKKVLQLQQTLESYTKDLAQQQQAKKDLLTQTQGSEANYQKLLAQAEAQLASFSSFVENQGGASLLSGQTDCSDSWGCYYNQRDSSWGGLSLNHTQYTIASDGCLVTSMAMVITHYGHKLTPIDINSNPSNFASYYPAYLLYTISAGGVTAQRVSAQIDSIINNDNHDPVIVGVRAYGGTHFVVLRSGSGGSYMMNDPYLANGANISFNAHYSVGSIFEVDKVVIQ